jgi:5'-deoxynucleotidase YfbR-like HD superfamily hydrolase
MKNFQTLYDSGAVVRWHTWPTIKEQRNSEHQWGVALIVAQIAPGRSDLLLPALTHDLAEVSTGDVPYHVKKANPELKEMLDELEDEFNAKHGLPLYNSGQSDEDAHILKWADMYELYLFSNRELQMGNQKMAKTMTVAREALLKMGPPTPEARALFERTGYPDE